MKLFWTCTLAVYCTALWFGLFWLMQYDIPIAVVLYFFSGVIGIRIMVLVLGYAHETPVVEKIIAIMVLLVLSIPTLWCACHEVIIRRYKTASS